MINWIKKLLRFKKFVVSTNISFLNKDGVMIGWIDLPFESTDIIFNTPIRSFPEGTTQLHIIQSIK